MTHTPTLLLVLALSTKALASVPLTNASGIVACVDGVPVTVAEVGCSTELCISSSDRVLLARTLIQRVLAEAVYVADVDVTDAEIAVRARALRPSDEQLAQENALHRMLGEAAIAVMEGAPEDKVFREPLGSNAYHRDMMNQLIAVARTPSAVRDFLRRDPNIDLDRSLTAAARLELTMEGLARYGGGLSEEAFCSYWRQVFALKGVVVFTPTFKLSDMRGTLRRHEITIEFH